MVLVRHIIALTILLTSITTWAQVERVLPIRGSSSLEGTSFVVGFMQNEIVEVDEPPRIQIFISAQFDATVTIASPIVGTYTITVPANTVHVETLRSDHVNTRSEIIQQKAVFITSDVPIVVYTLNTLAQSTDSYTAIPTRHLGTYYRTVNRPTDRYAGQNFFNQLPRVGEFMVIATEDNTVVTIDTPVPTWRRQRSIAVTLRKGDCYLVQALPTANGADDLTGSDVRSTKPVAVLSGHVRSSMPTVSTNSKDHLVEQLPPVAKWGKSYATAPMALQSTQKPPDIYRVVASKPDQSITCELEGRSFTWTADPSIQWFDTTLREPAFWRSSDPFLLVQCMPSGGSAPVNFDPAMVVIPPIEQFVMSALFQFPKLEINENITNQQFFYFINVVATPEALQTLRVDKTPVRLAASELLTQTIPGTNLHWAQVQLAEGSHVIQADSGLFTAIMYGTSLADSYANMVGVAYEPQTRKDISPPTFAMAIDCGAVFGEIRDVSKDTAFLADVYVVSAQTRNYRWTLTPVDDSSHLMIFEANVQDMSRDAQIVLHAYDNNGNGKEWKYIYDAPALAVPKSIAIQRSNTSQACTTLVVRNSDTSAVRITSAFIVADARFTVLPVIRDTLLAPKDSLVLQVCIGPTSDTGTINAVMRLQLPCSYRTIAITTAAGGMIRGSDVDLGNVTVGDTACAPMTITNTGATVMVLTAAMLQKERSDVSVDTAGLMLPRTIAPGDSVTVRVCFVPGDTGLVARTDTVTARGGALAFLTSRGRGVSPLIPPLVIDWGRRRVGSTNDTTVYIRNVGLGHATITVPLNELISPFRPLVADVSRQRLPSGDSTPVAIRYRPLARGLSEDTVAIDVSWKGHGPVQILARGIGVLPEIDLKDIDMGIVNVGGSRDSLVQLVSLGSASNAPLVVDSIVVIGPDTASFKLPLQLRNMRMANLVMSLIDSVRFQPTRPGMHVCSIAVVHNGAVDLPARDTFRIFGVADEPALPDVKIGITGQLNPLVCGEQNINITIGNNGTADAVLYDVRIAAQFDTTVISTLPAVLRLMPGRSIVYTYRLAPTTSTPYEIRVWCADSAGKTYSTSEIVRPRMPRAEIHHGWDSLPSDSRIDLVTGFHTILIHAVVDDTIDFVRGPMFRVDVSQNRFLHDPDAVQVIWKREGGIASDRQIRFGFRQSSTEIVVECLEVPKAPWEAIVRIGGQVLWKDDSVVATSAGLSSQPCIVETQSQPIDITTVPCAARVRQILLGQLPRVQVRPLQHPFDDVVSLEVESATETSVSVAIETLSGQEFQGRERFTLQKGLQHCNFSCSDWTPGLYRLVIYAGADIVDRKIIIVN